MPVRQVAVVLATGVLVTACGAGAAVQGGTVPACTAVAVQALERHVTLTSLPSPCRGLNRAQLNSALGRAIYEVAGTGQHKAAWRRRAAAAEGRLGRLIKSPPRPAAPPRPRPGQPPPPAPGSRWGTGLAALAAWLLTVGIGVFMLVPWIRRGGLHPPRAPRSRLGPAVTVGHAGAAGAGLLGWIAYLATGSTALAWLAVGVLLAVVGLGMATLTVWTAQASGRRPGPPAPGPVPARHTYGHLRIIVPVVHGLAASATILLALLTVVGGR